MQRVDDTVIMNLLLVVSCVALGVDIDNKVTFKWVIFYTRPFESSLEFIPRAKTTSHSSSTPFTFTVTWIRFQTRHYLCLFTQHKRIVAPSSYLSWNWCASPVLSISAAIRLHPLLPEVLRISWQVEWGVLGSEESASKLPSNGRS